MYLGLDIGTRRTGVAFADDTHGVALALDTIKHSSSEELVDAVSRIVTERNITIIVIGLPLLPSGEEGEQAAIVRKMAEGIAQIGPKIVFIDERYSSVSLEGSDDNSAAACSVLGIYLSKRKG